MATDEWIELFPGHRIDRIGAQKFALALPEFAALLDVADSLEWVDFDGQCFCPCCGNSVNLWHDPDCKLWAALKAFEDVKK